MVLTLITWYFFRLTVAAIIHESQNKTNLILRNTTVMPNIHGLPAFMALIFCPIMEPKVLPDGSRIAQVLCGLGHEEGSSKALYPQHDIIFTLDTELTEEELNLVSV